MRVLLFGAEAAAAGTRVVEVDIDSVTADELVAHVAARYPAIGTTCRVAVNQRFVDGDAKITSDDEVALIGPVSGG